MCRYTQYLAVFLLLSTQAASQNADQGEEATCSVQMQGLQVQVQKLGQELASTKASLEVKDQELSATLKESASMKTTLESLQKKGPFFSAEILQEKFRNIHSSSSKSLETVMPADLGKKVSAAKETLLQNMDAIRLNVADFSTVATKTVTESAKKASAAAIQMHKEHLEPHLDQHLAALQPHITKAKAMYSEKLDVHVQTVQNQALSIAAQTQTLAPQYYQKLQDSAQQVIQKVGNNKMPVQFDMNTINLQPLEFEFGGYVFNFPLGWLDVGLALVQALVLLYVAAKLAYVTIYILWKFVVKGLLVGVGYRLLCKRILKIVLWCTVKALKITIYAVKSTLCFTIKATFSVSTGAALAVGVTKLAKLAQHELDVSIQTGLFVAFAILLQLMCTCCCKCCSKRASSKKQAEKNQNGATNGHDNGKKNGNASKPSGNAPKAAKSEPVKNTGAKNQKKK